MAWVTRPGTGGKREASVAVHPPLVAGVTVAFLATGCGSTGSPVGPSVSRCDLAGVSSVSGPYAEGDPWDLLATYQGPTGPEVCIPPFDGIPRTPTYYPLRIKREGDSIQFISEHPHYVGTMMGYLFVGRQKYEEGATWSCGATRLRFRTEGQVSGSFSADGHSLTAVPARIRRDDCSSLGLDCQTPVREMSLPASATARASTRASDPSGATS
jgi:hypothetical protein